MKTILVLKSEQTDPLTLQSTTTYWGVFENEDLANSAADELKKHLSSQTLIIIQPVEINIIKSF